MGRTQIVQGFWFTPVVEPQHEGAFLTQRMYDAVADGGASQVPIMMGLMSEEQLSKAQCKYKLTKITPSFFEF